MIQLETKLDSDYMLLTPPHLTRIDNFWYARNQEGLTIFFFLVKKPGRTNYFLLVKQEGLAKETMSVPFR